MDRRRHSGRSVAYQDKQLVVTQTSRPLGLKLTGAVDATNAEAVSSVLDSTLRADGGTDVHIDVAGLEFADVSGIRVLVAAAERIDGTRRLILHGLPPLMTKVMDVVGWTDMPALNISTAEFPDGDSGPGTA